MIVMCSVRNYQAFSARSMTCTTITRTSNQRADAFIHCYAQAYSLRQKVRWDSHFLYSVHWLHWRSKWHKLNIQGRVNGPWRGNPKLCRRTGGDLEKLLRDLPLCPCLALLSISVNPIHALRWYQHVLFIDRRSKPDSIIQSLSFIVIVNHPFLLMPSANFLYSFPLLLTKCESNGVIEP